MPPSEVQDDPAERLAKRVLDAPPRRLHLLIEEIDSLVHDTKASEAALINNDGLPSQFEYLLKAGYTETELHYIIETNVDATEADDNS